ncbi:MAG: GNAT family N-acetyltransferase, partial [Xanthomonadales bacterium]|nr:GNAT family N-acetyltransferase [Xanthomonadales bacterium]
MIEIPELFTSRLVLRGHKADDHADTVRLWQSPAVYEAIGGKPPTEQEIWFRTLRYSGLWDLLGFGYWAVLERETGTYIGQLG